VKTPYIPDAGEFVWLTFDPQAGREQRGRRPALILSPRSYNRRSDLVLACPITSQIKGYPFEVVLPPESPITGAVLSDQLKSMDWRTRRVKFAAHAPPDVVAEVRERLRPLLGL
jgi:mRNA interferase MazF